MSNPHFETILKQSLHEKKSVGLYLSGSHLMVGVVYQITESVVFLKNREYNQILVRLDHIQAVVMH